MADTNSIANIPKTPGIDAIGLILEMAYELRIDQLGNGDVNLTFKITQFDKSDTIRIAAWKWGQVKQRYSRFIENMNADRD